MRKIKKTVKAINRFFIQIILVPAYYLFLGIARLFIKTKQKTEPRWEKPLEEIDVSSPY